MEATVKWSLLVAWSLRLNVDQPSDYACPGSCASFLGVAKSRQSVKPSDISHPFYRPIGFLRSISEGVIGQLGQAMLSFSWTKEEEGERRENEEDETIVRSLSLSVSLPLSGHRS